MCRTGALGALFNRRRVSFCLEYCEIKEWLVLYNKYIGKVSYYPTAFTMVQAGMGNLVTGGDALAKIF